MNDCGHEGPYGESAIGETFCYACAALRDREAMQRDGAITLYLTRDRETNEHAWKITNWPGTLRFPAGRVKHSRRGGGFGAQRTDAWFIGPDGATWHAVNRGDNEIARCRRVK